MHFLQGIQGINESFFPASSQSQWTSPSAWPDIRGPLLFCTLVAPSLPRPPLTHSRSQYPSQASPSRASIQQHCEQLYRDGFVRLLSKTYACMAARYSSRTVLHTFFLSWRAVPERRLVNAVVRLPLLARASPSTKTRQPKHTIPPCPAAPLLVGILPFRTSSAAAFTACMTLRLSVLASLHLSVWSMSSLDELSDSSSASRLSR